MSSKRQSLRAFQNDRNSLCVAGFALMRIVEVYKEIQEQEMNIVSTFFFFYTFHEPVKLESENISKYIYDNLKNLNIKKLYFITN